ncbi:MAG TPA: hypothetical protein V6D22_20465 [Candidatus Obscuribacterales bacterium]
MQKYLAAVFVGYCEQADDVYVFTTNISAPDDALGKRARAIAEAVLKQKHIL